MSIEWVAIPPALGVFLSALVELLKAAGVIKDGDGGRWALGGSIVVAALLTLGVKAMGLDLDAELPAALVALAGLAGQIITTLLGSFGSHKLFKATKVFPQHR
jgi:hypothetical protein